jgi:regulator of protease activity HflC (stomatin/prohibitin superfamily)
MNETAISTVAIEEIDDEVTVAMEEYLIDADLPLNLIQVTVGRANPPDAVKDQRVATATEQQRQLTEQQRKIAEDARLEAERSRAAADNAYRNSLGLSPAQFISLEAINMQRAACTGGTTCTFVLNGSALPTISVP